MAVPQTIKDWITRKYPKPVIDHEWLQDCCEWIQGEQGVDPIASFDAFIIQVEEQLLKSSLEHSTQPGTGLDAHVVGFTGHLSGPPITVQIVNITDIGASAFKLEEVRAAREERLAAGVGIEEGEDDGDPEVLGEGPLPKYPRGMLRFELFDGTTVLAAMEYRPIPELNLATTPLGYKLQLKGTRIRNGMAYLEPSTVQLLGGEEFDLKEEQEERLRQGLRGRLGLPPAPPARIVDDRSPLRDISPPPVPAFPPRDEDDLNRARRIPANATMIPEPMPPQREDGARPTIPLRRSVRALNAQDATASPYFAPPPPANRDAMVDVEIPDDVDYCDASSDYGMDTDFEDASFLNEINRAEQKALAANHQHHQQADATMADSEPYVRADARAPSHASLSSGGLLSGATIVATTSTLAPSPTILRTNAGLQPSISVISLDDSDESQDEEKENQPVPTRQVRQRMSFLDTDEEDEDIFNDENSAPPRLPSQAPATGRSQPYGSQPPQSQRRDGRPVILATRSEDIIELSD